MKNLMVMSVAAALLAGCVGGETGAGVGSTYATTSTGDAANTAPDNGDFLDGYEAIKQVDYVTAERELQRVLESDPNDPYANLAMGYVMQQTGRKAEARPLYDLALREGVDVYPDRHFVLSDREYTSRPAEEDSIAEMAARNIASLDAY